MKLKAAAATVDSGRPKRFHFLALQSLRVVSGFQWFPLLGLHNIFAYDGKGLGPLSSGGVMSDAANTCEQRVPHFFNAKNRNTWKSFLNLQSCRIVWFCPSF